MVAVNERKLLEVRGLTTEFRVGRRKLRAVNAVDLQVDRGEILGIVGESGSGKSVLAMSILRLVAHPGRITAGQVIFAGDDVARMSRRQLASFRGRGVGMIFQQPRSCLNPVRRIGWQVAEPFLRHSGMDRKTAWNSAVELLESVGLPAAAEKARAYPHQLSGGQAQRAMIALALAPKPKLVIADEPTTALDVTIQAQILELLQERCSAAGASLILVSHDLAVVAKLADRVAVMYAGRIVEEAPTDRIFAAPLHPYTQGLINAAPRQGLKPDERLVDIPGTIPDLRRPITGCAFAPRCQTRKDLGLSRCFEDEPPLAEVEPGRFARCWAVSPPERSDAAASNSSAAASGA